MSDDLKKEKIQEALSALSHDIGYYDIKISAAPFALEYDLQMARFEEGDKDIDKFTVLLDIGDVPHQVNCNFLSGESGEHKAIYFIVYKSCELINFDTYKTTTFEPPTQFWNDWKY